MCWLSLPACQLRVNINLIQAGIVKSSSDSGCETMPLDPNNIYSDQLLCQGELKSKVGWVGGKNKLTHIHESQILL